jgi:hypothetical protein
MVPTVPLSFKQIYRDLRSGIKKWTLHCEVINSLSAALMDGVSILSKSWGVREVQFLLMTYIYAT